MVKPHPTISKDCAAISVTDAIRKPRSACRTHGEKSESCILLKNGRTTETSGFVTIFMNTEGILKKLRENGMCSGNGYPIGISRLLREPPEEIIKYGNQVLRGLLTQQRVCYICGNPHFRVSMYHRKPKKILVKPYSPIVTVMLAINRRQISLCGHCFANVESDRFQLNQLKRR